MLAYAGRRILLLVPTLLALSIAVFLLIHLVPGDPAQVMLGERATPAALATLRAELGLGDPLWRQYGRFLTGLLHGDLGRSLKTHEEVTREIANRFPATVELAVAAMAIAAVVGIGLGALAAVRHRTIIDQLTMMGAVVGVSMPIFWLGLMLMLFFGVELGWLPIGGRLDTGLAVARLTGFLTVDALVARNWRAFADALAHIALPSFALSTIPMAVVARMTRSSLLDALRQDYVRTARAKGLGEMAVVMRHAVRNAFIPTLTVLGLQFGSLLGGAIITETIFAWPGVGRWLLLAVHARDFRAVQGGVLVIATAFVLVNLIVDLGYSILDPRVRQG